MTQQGDVFSRLPPEVIQHIAVTACGLTLTGPPAELATMLRISRSVHAALCVQFNPALHARVFSVKFDSRAPIRRFADAGEPLSALNFAHELQRRWVILKRIQDVTSAEVLLACSEEQVLEDLWVIYLMFLESDGRNLAQLHWARVTRYLRAVLREKLLPPPNPEYMVESTTRSLGLWLMWYLTEVYAIVAEAPSEAAPLRTMLRPWALASHRYDILFAPYTHWEFPGPDELSRGEEPVIETPRHSADLTLRNRAEVVTHIGHHIQLAPPRASLAAIMAFMVRIERNGPIPVHPAPPAQNPPVGQPPPTAQSHPGLTIYPRTRFPAFNGPGSIEFDGRVNSTGSATYDVEWRRALQCANSLTAPQFRVMPMFRPGDLVGHWQGRSVSLPMDAFRTMLTGGIETVANGPIVQISHSWHIQEHHLVSRRRRFPSGRTSDVVAGEKLPTGGALNAFIPTDAEFIHHIPHNQFGTRCLEVRVPDTSSSPGYKPYYYTTLDGSTDRPPVRISTNTVVSANHPPHVNLPPNWNKPQPPSLGDGDYEFEEEIIDTLITGEGRSNRDSFKLWGRVRAWDGMVIICKDYDAGNIQGRGRWLYRGYLTGGNWVGRWRDTFTSQELTGYEGVFSVTRQY